MRRAAKAGHHQLLARRFLGEPFGEVEIVHHPGNDLLRCLPQRDLFGLVEALALALAHALALARHRLHALGHVLAGEQRHHQRVDGEARGERREQHGHEADVVKLCYEKVDHTSTVRSRN